MPEEVSTTTTEAVKKVSDGMVKLSVEKYNELLETIASQKGSLSKLNDQLIRARNQPPVINRTIVEKTAEMAAQDNRAWGITLMGLGIPCFIVGAIRYKASRITS